MRARLAMRRPDWLTLLWGVWAMVLIVYVIVFLKRGPFFLTLPVDDWSGLPTGPGTGPGRYRGCVTHMSWKGWKPVGRWFVG